MIMKNNAVEYFTAVPKLHNCAQAVAEGAGRKEMVADLAACGGGRAPGGLCGALYALLLLAPESEHQNLKEAFKKEAGALTCCEIKSQKLYPCSECVRTASALSEKFLG